MKRFAKLTRDGTSCYVDPALAGLVGRNPEGLFSGPAMVLRTGICDRAGKTLIDGIDQDPDEVYRRLAAAGEVVTRLDLLEAERAVDDALAKAMRVLASPGFGTTMLNARSVEMAVSETLEPFRVAVSDLRRTVLAALWVAEGEDPNV